jgi:hypothetical protein
MPGLRERTASEGGPYKENPPTCNTGMWGTRGMAVLREGG